MTFLSKSKNKGIASTSNNGKNGFTKPMEFDLQMLLERRSLCELWNKAVKNGVLTDHQLLTSTALGGAIASPSGTFPCACCNPFNGGSDESCDVKCQAAASPSDHLCMETVSKIINGWTWKKEIGKHIVEKNSILYSY